MIEHALTAHVEGHLTFLRAGHHHKGQPHLCPFPHKHEHEHEQGHPLQRQRLLQAADHARAQEVPQCSPWRLRSSKGMEGWGLVEVLFASLLLSTGMVLVLKGQARLRDYSDYARERAAAAVLAEAQVERLRAGMADSAASADLGAFAALGTARKSAGREALSAAADPAHSSAATWPSPDGADGKPRGATAAATGKAPVVGSAEGKADGAAISLRVKRTEGERRSASRSSIPADLALPDAAADSLGVTESTWHEELDGSRYLFRQRLSTDVPGSLQDLDLELRWQDRSGMWQRLQWPARLGVGDPAVAILALRPQLAGDAGLVRGRHASIPDSARELSPGWVAFRPTPDLAEAWLLDAHTGTVQGLCELGGRSLDDLTAADVADCRARMAGGGALLLSGEIRFDLGERPSPAAPGSTALPLGLVLRLSDASASPDLPHCVSNAASAVARGSTMVSYHCLVYPRSRDQRWSGRSELSGLAADLKLHRVCRYSADHDHDGRITNTEHPYAYSDVEGPLTHQNFLVIRAGLSCPSGLPPDASAGLLLDMSTLPHQPPE